MLLTWLAGVATAYFATTAGVSTEKVILRLDDGTAIHGTLYRPIAVEASDARMPGVVVLHGSATAHASCVPGLATPLARNGFVTLAIDVRGHGDSGGSLPASEFGDLEALLGQRGEHPEVHAAVEFLKTRPGVDPDRIALVGHSRGGWAAAAVGVERDDIGCVVSIGVGPRAVNLNRPRNFMILTGAKDRLAPELEGRRAIAAATANAVREDDVEFGSLSDGTARLWSIVTRVNHFTQLADPSITRRAVQWVAGSFLLKAGQVPGESLVLAVAGAILATLAGVAAAALLLAPLSARLLSTPTAVRHASLMRIVGLCGLAFLTAPVVAVVTQQLPSGPVAFALPALALLACLTGGSLLLELIPQRRSTVGDRWSPGFSRSSRLKAGLQLLRPLLLGAFAFLLALLWLGMVWGATWSDLTPTPWRLLLGLVLLPLCLPLCLVLALGVQRAAGNDVSSAWRTLARGGLWLGLAVLLWLGQELFAAQTCPLFAVPVFFVAVSFLVPLPLWLVSDRSGLWIARGFCHAIGLAWLLACHLPFVHSG